jgi:hypothetical protein
MANGSEKRRKIGSNGTAWCFSHKAFISVNEFWKDKKRWNGLRNACKSCIDKKRGR